MGLMLCALLCPVLTVLIASLDFRTGGVARPLSLTLRMYRLGSTPYGPGRL